MSAAFHFDVDSTRHLVRLTLSGFFHRDDVAALARARSEAYRGLDCAPNGHATLIDVRELKIQSQETMKGFATLLSDREYLSRRVALVVAPTLARTQVERAFAARPGVACFADLAGAEAWLLGDDRDLELPLRAVG